MNWFILAIGWTIAYRRKILLKLLIFHSRHGSQMISKFFPVESMNPCLLETITRICMREIDRRTGMKHLTDRSVLNHWSWWLLGVQWLLPQYSCAETTVDNQNVVHSHKYACVHGGGELVSRCWARCLWIVSSVQKTSEEEIQVMRDMQWLNVRLCSLFSVCRHGWELFVLPNGIDLLNHCQYCQR